MFDADIIIGRDAIVVKQFQESENISWEDIVGVNRLKSIIFLKDGRMLKPGTFNRISLMDFGDNNIGNGDATRLKSWDKIFPVLKESTKKWGHCYIEEFETLYTSYLTISPDNFHLKTILSPEERKDRRRMVFLLASIFTLVFSSLLIKFVFLGGEQLSASAGIIIALVFLSIWILGIAFVFMYYRKSKIEKILKRHNIMIKKAG